MATVTLSHWFDSSNDEYEFPVVFLGDLTDYPDGDHSTYGSICGMSSNASGPYSFKSEVRVGDFPHVITPDEELTATLASYGRYEGTFYASSATISGQIWFKMTKVFNDRYWITYAANSSSDSVSTNDYAPSAGTDYNKVKVMLGIGTINGVNYLGLYYYGTGLGYNPDDPYNAWCFCYETGENSAWASIQEILELDEGVPNPYRHGGYSTEGGGDRHKQKFDDYSDIVNPDSMPDETSIGAVASGLISIFTPSKSQVQALADIFWQKDFLDFMDSLFSNIEDLIISFGMVPFTVPVGGTGTITWFDYAVLVPGQVHRFVTLNKPSSQFIEFNMGNVSLTGGDTSNGYASDSVLDYSPYSKLGIYLPFIGYEEMNIDECRGNSINLKYRIDILSGAVLALISINGRTLYQFTGNCLVQLPVTSQDCSQMIANTVNVGIAAASAGATGAIASAGDALTSARLENGAITAEMGEFQNAQHAAQVSNASGSLAGATANATMGMKPNYKMSGAISGSTCMVGVKQPYLFLTTPRQSMPEGYEKVCGFPCNMGGKLGDFTGFTVVEDIRLNGLVATSPEVDEIYKLLKSGVII